MESENNKKEYLDEIIYQIEESARVVDLKDYLNSYHKPDQFIKYCKGCDRYCKSWACPPFDFDTKDYFKPFRSIVIISTKIMPHSSLNDWIKEGRCTMSELYKVLLRKERKRLDEILLKAESLFHGSRACFAGNCHFCKPEDCTKQHGKACRFPEKIRPSIEALGCDVANTMSEVANIKLLWSKDGLLPQYYCLVSAILLTNKEDERTIKFSLKNVGFELNLQNV